MIRGGTLLILNHGVKGQGQLCPPARGCHALRCLVIPLQHGGWYRSTGGSWASECVHLYRFQTTHVSCSWWEMEPHWFWVTWLKVKVNFDLLSVRPFEATKWGGVSESPYKKGGPRVGARTGTLKNPTKCLWRWEPDCRSNFFFSPPAHLCAVTCMTEISLIVTLNNQFTSPRTQCVWLSHFQGSHTIK